MRILYLHQHFALPSGSGGTRSYEFARRWVKAGHQVIMICGRGDICGLPQQSEFEVEGIQVKIVGATYSQKQSFVRRIWAFLHFMFACVWHGIYVKNTHVIYATSTPLTIGIPAMIISGLKKIPFVFEVRDQWPEVPIEMNIIKNNILCKMLLWLEKKIYRSAAAVVALSPGMADGVRSVLGKLSKQILVAPNSSDTDLFQPSVDGSLIRCQMNWQDKFVILHFGTMGRANGLEFLLDAAKQLGDDPQVHFVLLGSGREKDRLKKIAENRNLTNIQIMDGRPKKELPQWVAACDLSTVVFANYPILEQNSANKYFDSLSAGKPILLNYSGWQRTLLEENDAGYGCKQFEVNEYVSKVRMCISQKDQLKKMGQNARRLAETCFSRDKLAADVLDLLKAVNAQYQKS
jgi:glycosyltransferase involved in cell wall biosynthesis